MLCVSTWLTPSRLRQLPVQSSILQSVLWRTISGLILLQGKRFDEIPYYFPDGSVFGLVNVAAQRCLLNPPADTRVQEGDALIMMRPTSIASDAYRPLPRPIAVTPGEVVPAAAAHCPVPCRPVPACAQLRCGSSPHLPALRFPRHT